MRLRILLLLGAALIAVAQLSRPGPAIRAQRPARPYEAVMLGSEALLVDYYWFDLLQYFGGYRLGEHDLAGFIPRFERLLRLDPGFHRANIFAAVVRAQEMEDPAGAIQWLRYAERVNPQVWEYPYEQGFLNYLLLDNYRAAVADFRRAGRIEGAPPAWRHFEARITELGGDPRIARDMWMQIAESAEHPGIRETALRNAERLEGILLVRGQDGSPDS